VDADKGFNFAVSDDTFVCQKKNHFQVSKRWFRNIIKNHYFWRVVQLSWSSVCWYENLCLKDWSLYFIVRMSFQTGDCAHWCCWSSSLYQNGRGNKTNRSVFHQSLWCQGKHWLCSQLVLMRQLCLCWSHFSLQTTVKNILFRFVNIFDFFAFSGFMFQRICDIKYLPIFHKRISILRKIFTNNLEIDPSTSIGYPYKSVNSYHFIHVFMKV